MEFPDAGVVEVPDAGAAAFGATTTIAGAMAFGARDVEVGGALAEERGEKRGDAVASEKHGVAAQQQQLSAPPIEQRLVSPVRSA